MGKEETKCFWNFLYNLSSMLTLMSSFLSTSLNSVSPWKTTDLESQCVSNVLYTFQIAWEHLILKYKIHVHTALPPSLPSFSCSDPPHPPSLHDFYPIFPSRENHTYPLEPSLLLSFLWSVNYSMVIFYFIANINLQINIYHACFSVSVTSLRMIFLVPSIFCQISWCHCF